MKKNILYFILIITISFILLTILYTHLKTAKQISNPAIIPPSPFIIKKAIFYSGITPQNTKYTDNENWIFSLSQYTDMAIYIQRNSDILNDSNTIKTLYIDNIKYTSSPKLGTPSLYYQNPLKFATDSISNDYLVDKHLTYNILNFENTENYNYYSTPNFFTDCSIPLTLKYVNSNIIKNFKLSNTETLFFNGSILKKSNFNLKDIESKLLFCINIVTNDNKFYTQNLELEIPLSNSSYTLLDQNIYIEKELNLNFKETKKEQ